MMDYFFVSLGTFAFLGGLIDAAVGGGGLVQLPALLHALPQYSMATVFGTNKLAVLAGTASSTLTYIKKVTIIWKLVIPALVSALVFAFIGALSVSLMPKTLMRYVVFFLLILMAIYTFLKKDLGKGDSNKQCGKREIGFSVFFGGLIGFYDGVFGPGSGSFLLFLFVRCFGFNFLNASVSAKIVNLGSFTASLAFFIPSGNVLWLVGFVIAVCNVLGSILGSILALRYGSGFIRILFLILLVFLIGRMGVSLFTSLS